MQLTPSDVKPLMDRFYNFYDGVVRDVEILLRAEPPCCRVVIECKDREAESGWSTVEFVLRSLAEFRFEVGRTTFEVLSSGVQIAWSRGLVFLVLDAYPDDAADLPNLSTNTAYAGGLECEWDLKASLST